MATDNNTQIREDQNNLPANLLVLPLTTKPLFPGMFAPLFISGEKDMVTVNQALSNDGIFGAILERPNENKEENRPDHERFHSVGTVCRILKSLRMPDGGMNIFVSTIRRFRVESFFSTANYTAARVTYLEDEPYDTDSLKAWIKSLNAEFTKINTKTPIFSEENRLNMVNIEDPSRFADYVASILPIDGEKAQSVLEILDVKKRIEEVLFYISQERKIAEIQADIQTTINKRLEKNQRDYFLREEMKQIQKQLGMDGKSTNIVEKLRSQLNALDLQGEAKETVENEYARFVSLEPNSPDYSVCLNYLQTVAALPWKDEGFQDFDIQKARKILEKDHYGMKEVKDRILEFLAVRKQKQDTKGAIICLVGPPGVGKTSVGRSIARALGKKYYRFSVGGMKDEAEIKGHRRTYVGALPGKIIQGLKIVKTKSPVFLIDEIDKMGQSYNGDPASALLEALDSEQNKEFRDRYLDIPFDVSQVLFIVTANTLETIPGPLLDRMEIIELSGYTSNEKLNIAKKYLLPKSYEKTGLSKNDVKYSSKALLSIANQYAREAGVRNLEKSLDKINRKVLLDLLENPDKERPVNVDEPLIEKYLGLPIFPVDDIVKADKVGTAIGLAWTSMGGDTLLIEAENYPGKGEMKVTGQLGDVMKESVSIAWTYLKRTAERRGIDRAWFEQNNVHLHIPEGATPKDGPSAGITLTCALYSLLTDQVIKDHLAMTGELTLTGKVMPIGGLREKVLAAKRNGIKTIIIPKRNERDLKELTEDVRQGVDFHLVSEMDEVLRIAFPDDKTVLMSEAEYKARLDREAQDVKTQEADRFRELERALRSVLD